MNPTYAAVVNSNASSRFDEIVESIEGRHPNSELIGQYIFGNRGKSSVEPANPERALSRWLAVDDVWWRSDQARLDASAEDGINAHLGGIADDFVATIPERIRFWSEVRRSLLELYVEVIGTLEIASYLERLIWVYNVGTDEGFRSLDGSHRLSIIAVAVLFGSEAALRAWSGSDLSDDEVQDLVWAQNELIFMVERDKGTVVEFKAEGSAW